MATVKGRFIRRTKLEVLGYFIADDGKLGCGSKEMASADETPPETQLVESC